MGIYVNPGNSGFEQICRVDYVDKTGILSITNERIDGTKNLFCVSRPRRFGKSYAAKMLAAYYDCSCDSRHLFDDKAIAKSESYLANLNQYNVILLDITAFLSEAKARNMPINNIPQAIQKAIKKDLDIHTDAESLNDILIRFVEQTGKKIIFIIDEWDAVIREAQKNSHAQYAYLNLLRGWFKNINFTPKAVAAAYMTGILPIKKDLSQSAISDFKEYTILNPGDFALYTGFTESEVQQLCLTHSIDFEDIRKWYDGYDFPGVGPVYNPYSVMCAIDEGHCKSFWQKTSAAGSLLTYINLDFKGLQSVIARLIAGERVDVNVDSFQNDFETFNSMDDVLTLLIHLGYLTYDQANGTARIPNEEVRIEFRQILKDSGISTAWTRLIQRSQKLLNNTLAGNGDSVASIIEEIRCEEYAPQYYNNEQALRSVIKYAYLAALGQYIKVEELPSGKGIADVAYIPKSTANLPALLIELKWNKSSGGAIKQAREKHYADILKPFRGNILLVGINYDEKTKTHSCVIEET